MDISYGDVAWALTSKLHARKFDAGIRIGLARDQLPRIHLLAISLRVWHESYSNRISADTSSSHNHRESSVSVYISLVICLPRWPSTANVCQRHGCPDDLFMFAHGHRGWPYAACRCRWHLIGYLTLFIIYPVYLLRVCYHSFAKLSKQFRGDVSSLLVNGAKILEINVALRIHPLGVATVSILMHVFPPCSLWWSPPWGRHWIHNNGPFPFIS